MSVRILTGDCREMLRILPDESVQCVVTSPPYWGLRDYGVDGQIGLERSPDAYVAEIVGVAREIRRLLRSDGTFWLNLGDSYSGSGKGGNPEAGKQATNKGSQSIGVLYGTGKTAREAAVTNVGRRICAEQGIAPKQLIGIPWRVALALQADGWWLRQDIIWSKPNPMPESVTDRCTRAHEYIFMLSKSARYYYDNDAVREPYSEASIARYNTPMQTTGNRIGGRQPGCIYEAQNDDIAPNPLGRNRRDVWTVTTEPFKGAHFATFPPALIEPCILAGCPQDGTVLDPFFGAGTTGLVCDRLNRNCIGIELNPDYAALAEKRIRGESPLFAEGAA